MVPVSPTRPSPILTLLTRPMSRQVPITFTAGARCPDVPFCLQKAGPQQHKPEWPSNEGQGCFKFRITSSLTTFGKSPSTRNPPTTKTKSYTGPRKIPEHISNFPKGSRQQGADSKPAVSHSKAQSDAFFPTLLFAQPSGLEDGQGGLADWGKCNSTWKIRGQINSQPKNITSLVYPSPPQQTLPSLSFPLSPPHLSCPSRVLLKICEWYP